MKIGEVAGMLLALMIAIGLVIWAINKPVVYKDQKHVMVSVYCHNSLVLWGELVNETDTTFTVQYSLDYQYPKSICTYTITNVFYN